MRWQGENLSEAKRIGNSVMAGTMEHCECCGGLSFRLSDGSLLSLEPGPDGVGVWAFDPGEWEQGARMH